MSHVPGLGVDLAVAQEGDGPPVLLVHGMAADGATWEPVRSALAGAARVITYDRRGYGGSGAPEPYERTTVQEQAEDAATLLAALDAAPAVLCGADFGALVCLDLLVRHPAAARGAVLLGPPLLWLVAGGSEALAVEREALTAALEAGGPAHAVEAWLGGIGGPARAERAAAAHRAFFADWAGLATGPAGARELRGIAAPLTVLDGERASPEIVAAADALVGLVPGARRRAGADPVPELRAMLAGG